MANVYEKFDVPDSFDPSAGGGTLQFGPFDTGIKTPEGLDRFLAGAGKNFSDTGLGIKQALIDYLASGETQPAPTLSGVITGKQPKGYFSDLAEKSRAEFDARKARDKPLMDTGAGLAGNITAAVLPSFILPAGGATIIPKLITAAAAGGAQSAVQPVGTDDSRGLNTAVGAALGVGGQAAASLVGAIANGATKGADAARAAAYKWAADNGIDLTRGQMSGNKFTMIIENVLSALPGSRGFYARSAQSQQAGLDRVLGKLTMEGESGSALQQAGAGRTWTSDQPFITEMQNMPSQFNLLAGGLKPKGAIATGAEYAGGSAAAPPLVGGRPASPQMLAALRAQGVEIPGEQSLLPLGATMPMVGPKGDFNNYQAIRSQLGKLSFGAAEASPESAGYSAMKDAFDAAAERSMAAQGVDPKLMDTIRASYKTDKLLRPAGTIGAEGDVTYSAAKVATAINKAAQKNNLTGLHADDLLQIANLARSLRPANTSLTTETGLASKLATFGLLGELAGEKSTGHDDLIPNWAKIGAGLVAAPWAVNKLVQGTRGGVPWAKDLPPQVGTSLSQLLRGILPAVAIGESGR